jgi:hypothetical protein
MTNLRLISKDDTHVLSIWEPTSGPVCVTLLDGFPHIWGASKASRQDELRDAFTWMRLLHECKLLVNKLEHLLNLVIENFFQLATVLVSQLRDLGVSLQ